MDSNLLSLMVKTMVKVWWSLALAAYSQDPALWKRGVGWRGGKHTRGE